MTTDWDIIGLLKASAYRRKILAALREPKTPSDLAQETGIKLGHVSNVLADLIKHDLAVCRTPERKKGRIYEATDRGKTILKKI